MISSCVEKNASNIFRITTKVIYGYKRGLVGRIYDCKLVIYAEYFDAIRKMDDKDKKHRKRKKKGISIGMLMTSLDEQKICVHNNLKVFQAYTDRKI